MWIKYKSNVWVDLGRKVSCFFGTPWLWMGVPTSSRRRICCRMVLGATNICLSGHPFSPLANRFVPWLEESLVFEGYFVFLTNALIRNQENLMETIHINVFYYVYNVSYIYIYTHTFWDPWKSTWLSTWLSPFLWKCKGCVHLQYIYIQILHKHLHIYIYRNK